jgi:hypothetical protein
MDTATLIAAASTALNLVAGLIAYLLKTKMEQLDKHLQSAQEDIVDIRVNYAHKNDVIAMKHEILSRFDRLEDKLTKAS